MMKSVGATSTAKIDSAPRSLRESLVFPYDQGMAWVRQLYQRGGWKAVDEAYASLPQSTEQILHPEKYFAHEAPAQVVLPDLSPALGRDWKQIDTDVNGEWGYYLILDEFLKDEKESKQAAAGWGGDRYALYENKQTRETLLAQVTAWDTEQDASEFFDAYVKRTQKRLGLAARREGRADNEKTSPDIFVSGDRTVAVRRAGSRVTIIEGVPPKKDAAALMHELIGGKAAR
jgi:hypothetical protein